MIPGPLIGGSLLNCGLSCAYTVVSCRILRVPPRVGRSLVCRFITLPMAVPLTVLSAHALAGGLRVSNGAQEGLTMQTAIYDIVAQALQLGPAIDPVMQSVTSS